MSKKTDREIDIRNLCIDVCGGLRELSKLDSEFYTIFEEFKALIPDSWIEK